MAKPGHFWTADSRFSLEDIEALALPILRHRVLTNFQAEAQGSQAKTSSADFWAVEHMSELRAKYLDPDLLSKLGSLQLKATALAEGIIAGLHRSPHRGGSVEFSEYSEYSPGHEIRHIDWKVFGKSDKYYVKQFQDETNLRTYFVLDGSGSMNYASKTRHSASSSTCVCGRGDRAPLHSSRGCRCALNVSEDGTAKYLPASSKKNISKTSSTSSNTFRLRAPTHSTPR